jgi:hypothetical protein
LIIIRDHYAEPGNDAKIGPLPDENNPEPSNSSSRFCIACRTRKSYSQAISNPAFISYITEGTPAAERKKNYSNVYGSAEQSWLVW